MIQIIAVGKLKEKATKALVDEYLKRLQPYSRTEIIEVSDEPNSSEVEAEELRVKRIEGERILKQIKKDSYVILLDLRGREMSSPKLAEKISEINSYHASNITFIIGGSLGVSDEVVKRADLLLKLSEMTFPHNLVRILILEQIYRAYKILNHEPYHK